ncbi:MAG TPA: peptidase S1 [Acidimicrobiaceae bacterium]|nr:peptidase S1 [Acidimicrobiaceae bacterium]
MSAVLVLSNDRATVVERVVERVAVPVGGTTGAVGVALGTADGTAAGALPSIADVVARVSDSVLRVEVYNGPIAVGTGSAVVLRDDGHVLTNSHVVDGGSIFVLVTAGGTRLRAQLVGADELTDIAVLRAVGTTDGGPAPPLTPATLGSTVGLRAGHTAIAIGSPLGLRGGPTVTVGVISAVHRQIQGGGGDIYYDLVQTDAPISPGSSGGALTDRAGALVGITTLVAVSEIGAEGLAFATPVEIAHDVATDIINHGRARHGWLGISGGDATAAQLDGTGVPRGVTVFGVADDGPAARAGLRAGDVLLSLAGVPVMSMGDLVADTRLLQPGDAVPVELYRDGRRETTSVTVGLRP